MTCQLAFNDVTVFKQWTKILKHFELKPWSYGNAKKGTFISKYADYKKRTLNTRVTHFFSPFFCLCIVFKIRTRDLNSLL